ncbi:4'-phosphopantetheinyl transferase superfamily protein [Streptomyces sp. NPDC047042]|uniref:4'-phosphopantetheinyl transferase family protein n=1 Tax=Streptomyces sp. NPDC047042 TaxID=3154807 RepID=UPI003411A3BB
MIEEVVPGHVAGHEAYGDSEGITLHPGEEAVARGFAASRRAAFTTGRYCARRALADLGETPGAILRTPGGAPHWPASVVGSITHCDGYRAAAVASRDRAAAVGIDAEPNREVPEDVLEFISTPQERIHVRELLASRGEVRWDRLLFCVKESVYKVWHPLTGLFLGFREAEVGFAADTAEFDVRLRPRGGRHRRLPETLHGRWTSRDGLLLTAITLSVTEGES